MIANKRIIFAWRSNILEFCRIKSPQELDQNPWVLRYLDLLYVAVDLALLKYGEGTLLQPAMIMAEADFENMVNEYNSVNRCKSSKLERYMNSMPGMSGSKYLTIDGAIRLDRKTLSDQEKQHSYIWGVLRRCVNVQFEHTMNKSIVLEYPDSPD